MLLLPQVTDGSQKLSILYKVGAWSKSIIFLRQYFQPIFLIFPAKNKILSQNSLLFTILSSGAALKDFKGIFEWWAFSSLNYNFVFNIFLTFQVFPDLEEKNQLHYTFNIRITKFPIKSISFTSKQY